MIHKSLESIPESKEFKLPVLWKKGFWMAVGIGLISALFGLVREETVFWNHYLLNYFFWMSLVLSGVFFTALQYVSGASWSVPLRRIPELLGGLFPLVLLLFIILFFGLPSIYEWTHADVVAADPLLRHKAAYLNIPFFAFRNILFLLLWGGAGFLFLRFSTEQDRTGAVHLSRFSGRLAAPFLVFFALSYTLTSFDLLMSLEPHWFSTIFGVYCFAGLFLSGLALITVIVILLKKQGVLPFINDSHLHDLGKFMFAFTIFWA
ncbi:MAG: hypothetical protein Q7S00_01265, partial [bacterium]|nr:hypothetical protein [bacterium]